MELYLVRHTRLNIPLGICYGQSEIPLAETFPDEARQISDKLKGITEAHLYTSPLERCAKLAAHISNEPAIIEPRLKELNFGQWEMKKWDAIDRKAVDKWTQDFVNNRCPGGESYYDLNLRVKEWMADLHKAKVKKAIAVTHAGVIRIFRAKHAKLMLSESFTLKVDHGDIYRVVTEDDFIYQCDLL
ncbi:MAG: alpha-ribazole phosphatase [Verrucomicrobiae bacterium]|nr:alpha-ribazole phosphatase [Verrucomicrobiae bacterium]